MTMRTSIRESSLGPTEGLKMPGGSQGQPSDQVQSMSLTRHLKFSSNNAKQDLLRLSEVTDFLITPNIFLKIKIKGLKFKEITTSRLRMLTSR